MCIYIYVDRYICVDYQVCFCVLIEASKVGWSNLIKSNSKTYQSSSRRPSLHTTPLTHTQHHTPHTTYHFPTHTTHPLPTYNLLTLTHTHTQLTHTPLAHTHTTYSLSRTHSDRFHTRPCTHTHTTLLHTTLLHTTLLHTTLSTAFFYTQLFHTQTWTHKRQRTNFHTQGLHTHTHNSLTQTSTHSSFTRNFVTHTHTHLFHAQTSTHKLRHNSFTHTDTRTHTHTHTRAHTHTNISVTCDCFTHTHTQKTFHTQLFHAQIVTHTQLFTTTLSHKTLSHTPLWHTHTQPVTHDCFTYNIVTHTHNPSLSRTALSHTTLSHTALSRTVLSHNLFSTISYIFSAFPIPFSDLFWACWKKLTCGLIRSFNFGAAAQKWWENSGSTLDGYFGNCIVSEIRYDGLGYLINHHEFDGQGMPGAPQFSGIGAVFWWDPPELAKIKSWRSPGVHFPGLHGAAAWGMCIFGTIEQAPALSRVGHQPPWNPMPWQGRKSQSSAGRRAIRTSGGFTWSTWVQIEHFRSFGEQADQRKKGVPGMGAALTWLKFFWNFPI